MAIINYVRGHTNTNLMIRCTFLLSEVLPSRCFSYSFLFVIMMMLAASRFTSRFPVAFSVSTNHRYCVLVPFLPQTKLFNREKEVEFLLNVYKNKMPQLSWQLDPSTQENQCSCAMFLVIYQNKLFHQPC